MSQVKRPVKVKRFVSSHCWQERKQKLHVNNFIVNYYLIQTFRENIMSKINFVSGLISASMCLVRDSSIGVAMAIIITMKPLDVLVL